MTISIYERSMAADQEAVSVLNGGPMAWLAELDLLWCEREDPTSVWLENDFEVLQGWLEQEFEIRQAMLELERTGAWYDPQRYALCFPPLNYQSTWSLIYAAPGAVLRTVSAEVDRW